jgi:hypothetical protein
MELANLKVIFSSLRGLKFKLGPFMISMKSRVRKGIKFCIDCKNYFSEKRDGVTLHLCERWAREEIDSATGKTKIIKRSCHEMRGKKVFVK